MGVNRTHSGGVFQHGFNMDYGYSTRLYFNHQRVKLDGTATVYVQLVFARKKKNINLEFSWPVDRIDIGQGFLMPRKRGDRDCSDFNIIIKNELAKINEVFRMARLAGKKLTMDQVMYEYTHFASRDDFIQYALDKIEYRKENGLIREVTARGHKSSIGALKKYRNTLSFSEISVSEMENFKAYMYNKLHYDSDTALTRLKNIRTYMNLARKDHKFFDYPFPDLKMPKSQERVEFLTEEEVQKLKAHFESGHLNPETNRYKSLKMFLFICYTGLRLGDMKKLHAKHLKKDSLVFVPNKATSDKQEQISIPLHPFAMSLVGIGKKGLLFDLPPEQKIREKLKDIADKLRIESSIGPHIGRHTFATRFLKGGGRLEVLQKLLGHAKITTTMIYVHVTEADKRQEINLLP